MSIFYTSDLHLGHDKDFIYQARGFDSIKDHDDYIINHWANTVGYHDTLVLVGDFLMGRDKEARALDILTRMPYGYLIWVLGNHDPKPERIKSALEILMRQRLITIYPMGANPDLFGRTVSHFPPEMIGERTEERIAYLGKFAPALTPGSFVHGHTHKTEKYLSVGDTEMFHVGWDAHRSFVQLPLV